MNGRMDEVLMDEMTGGGELTDGSELTEGCELTCADEID